MMVIIIWSESLCKQLQLEAQRAMHSLWEPSKYISTIVEVDEREPLLASDLTSVQPFPQHNRRKPQLHGTL